MKTKIALFSILLGGLLVIQTASLAQTTSTQLKTANEYLNNNRFHIAIPIYQSILKKEPSNTLANYGLGMCYLEVIDKRIAHIYLKKAHSADNKLPEIESNISAY